jgi:ATP-dependent protease ClpP protease subunit
MSSATWILAAGDERVITKNTWFMMHQSRVDDGGMSGTFDECMNEMKWWNALETQIYKLYEELSKNKTKWTTFRKLCRKDHYIRAEDVLKLGLVDKIQGVR